MKPFARLDKYAAKGRVLVLDLTLNQTPTGPAIDLSGRVIRVTIWKDNAATRPLVSVEANGIDRPNGKVRAEVSVDALEQRSYILRVTLDPGTPSAVSLTAGNLVVLPGDNNEEVAV